MQYSFFAAVCLDLFFVSIIIHIAAQLQVLGLEKFSYIPTTSSGRIFRRGKPVGGFVHLHSGPSRYNRASQGTRRFAEHYYTVPVLGRYSCYMRDVVPEFNEYWQCNDIIETPGVPDGYYIRNIHLLLVR
ncbi:uncharacterized protein LOC126413229 [Schistocerca serialis cubense]|uniref:uncharacterized protein LOC126413229 n=1 Tax=Schistocerca serialis cubense TaxID=2023355 RepID=UPI00214E1DFD|nr:uncharacterized protein LOC126413229 [Schistocerca serialis cubense]